MSNSRQDSKRCHKASRSPLEKWSEWEILFKEIRQPLSRPLKSESKHGHPYWLHSWGSAILNTRHQQKMKRISIPGLPGHSLGEVNLPLQRHRGAVPLVHPRPSASTQGGAGCYLSIIVIRIIMRIMLNLPHLLITDLWCIIDCAYVFLKVM